MKITTEELGSIRGRHDRRRRGEPGGECADLSDRRAFYWLKRVTNMDINVCGKRAFLQQHGVMKGDVLRRVIPRDGAGPLARVPRRDRLCRDGPDMAIPPLSRRTLLNRAASDHNSARRQSSQKCSLESLRFAP